MIAVDPSLSEPALLSTDIAEALALTEQLINIPSITPEDRGCQRILSDYLQGLGFTVKHIPVNAVSNFLAFHGSEPPLLLLSGHTDVVPPGPEADWITPPFVASQREGCLYGRGAADMKAALAAMLVASKRFLKQHPQHKGTLGFMVTSDEEGEAQDGTVKLVEYLKEQHIDIRWCLIGEASSHHTVGDVIKVGRRGSLHGYLEVLGKQGHIAYPHQAENAIHRCFRVLDELTQIQWDEGNEFFHPTSFQIYNIQADTGATNIIPGSLTTQFNFRFSPASTADSLQKRVHQVFDEHQLQYKIRWHLASRPFLSQSGALTQAAKETIREVCQIETRPDTTGGTSDGRFIAPTGAEVVELGFSSQSIHQVNECIKIEELGTLVNLYEGIVQRLLGAKE